MEDARPEYWLHEAADTGAAKCTGAAERVVPAAAGIIALIAGDEEQRCSAYQQLAAIARGDSAAVAETIRAASVRLEGGPRDAAALTEACRQFGTVLAVTPGQEGALLTFGEAAEAQKAVDGAASELAASGLAVSRLVDTSATSEAMRQHRERVGVMIAAACVGPLAETVFAADIAVVSASEFQRASSTLAELLMLPDPWPVLAEFLRHNRFSLGWSTPGNAYNAVFQKGASQLSMEDAMTVALYTDGVCMLPYCFRGFDNVFDAVDVGEFDWLGQLFAHQKLHPPHGVSADVLVRLCELWLEVARDPQSSDLVQAGAFLCISLACYSRPAVAVPIINAGLLDAGVAALERSSPSEWLAHKQPAAPRDSVSTRSRVATGVLAASVFWNVWMMSMVELPDKLQLLLEKGVIRVCISVLKAFELEGGRRVSETNVGGIICCLLLLGSLDLTAPDALPIVRQLEGMASTLFFVLENPLSHMRNFGWETSAQTSKVCALAFGKQEGGSQFIFTQEMIDRMLRNLLVNLSENDLAAELPQRHVFLRSVVHLCISDINKELLIKSPELKTSGPDNLLLSALLLDPQHVRQDEPDEVKAAVQQDASECFLQLATYGPGREMLQQLPEVHEALRTLVDKAWTDEARSNAEGALMALSVGEPDSGHQSAGRSQPDAAASTKHVMLSYQWDQQPTVKRIVNDLRVREYETWFDLDNMKVKNPSEKTGFF
jgi:hypothetical protein